MNDLLGIDVNETFAGLLAGHLEAAGIIGLDELADRLDSPEFDRDFLARWIDEEDYGVPPGFWSQIQEALGLGFQEHSQLFRAHVASFLDRDDPERVHWT